MSRSSFNPTRLPAADLSTAWLATALLLLPWAYRLEWDTPRAVPLLLFAPALWFGRTLITQRLSSSAASGSRMRLVACVLAAIVLLSIVGSAHWAASLATASTWCVFALCAVLVAELISQTPRATPWLLGAMAASLALGTATHLALWKAGGSPQDAFYVHPRLMGLHALGGAMAAVAMFLHAWPSGGRQRALWLVVGVLAWTGLLWSGSRSPLVGIAAGLLIWLARLGGRERVRLLGATAALGAGGLLVSALFWIDAPALGWWTLARRAPAAEVADQITSNRASVWSASLEHVKASPVLGYGPDAYGFLTPQLEGAQPHNLILQLALDLGAPGALLALVLAAACLWRGWTRSAKNGLGSAWVALATGCIVSAQLDGYFYYPLAAAVSWLAFGACMAHRAAPPAAAQASGLLVRIGRAWPWAAGAAAAILLVDCWLFHQAVHGAPPANPHTFTARVWRAFPSVTFNVDEWVMAWAREYPDEALAASLLARRHSQSPELFRVATARLLASRGDYAGAITQLELALHEARPAQRPAIVHWLERIRAAAARR